MILCESHGIITRVVAITNSPIRRQKKTLFHVNDPCRVLAQPKGELKRPNLRGEGHHQEINKPLCHLRGNKTVITGNASRRRI